MSDFLEVINFEDFEKIIFNNFFSILSPENQIESNANYNNANYINNAIFSENCFEILPLSECLNRLSFEDIYSHINVPMFNKSTVDGYAVRSRDLKGANNTNQIQLKIAGKINIGEKPDLKLNENEAIYIPTGGFVPDGADAIIMEEDTENYDDGFIYCNQSVSAGENIVFEGDDVKKGELLVKKGELLNEIKIALIAGSGYKKVKVFRKIKAGIISTGDEIIEPFIEPNIKSDFNVEFGKVFDSNSFFLENFLKNYGGFVNNYGIFPDNFDSLKTIVTKAINENDLVIISGGSSKGQKDNTVKLIESFGKNSLLFHGIAIKPGKPTILGKIENKPIIGLPGHPGAVIAVSIMFLKKLILTMVGVKTSEIEERYFYGVMGTNYPSNNGRTEFLPVKVVNQNGKNIVYPIFLKSAQVKNFCNMDGYVLIDRNCEGLNENDSVKVFVV